MKSIAILICFAVLLTGCAVVPPEKAIECSTNADCVPAQCCHPTECTNIENAPDCTGVFCTQECVPGTLDCGQGSCVCDNGICTAEFVTK